MMDHIKHLAPALFRVFSVIVLGLIIGRCKVIQPQDCKGIGQFLGKLALPALLFRGMATLDWSTVEWCFLIAVVGSKTIVFTIVAVFTFLTHGRDKPAVAKAGLYGLFATQSNDFALGLPIIRGVFKTTHPAFIRYSLLNATHHIDPPPSLTRRFAICSAKLFLSNRPCASSVDQPHRFLDARIWHLQRLAHPLCEGIQRGHSK
jgi:hypothetical protein